MFSSINSERKDDFLDKAKKARDSRAEEKKRAESVIKMQVNRYPRILFLFRHCLKNV